MLGDKFYEAEGRITNRRVLPSEGAPQVESTFEEMGKLFGVAGRNIGTYQATARPDGTLYGQGQGVWMGSDGGMVSWTGQGVGRFTERGGQTFRGSLYFQTASPNLVRLNGVVGVIEYEVDENDKSRGAIWEWK